jgi:hypothetical protein
MIVYLAFEFLCSSLGLANRLKRIVVDHRVRWWVVQLFAHSRCSSPASDLPSLELFSKICPQRFVLLLARW